MNERTDEIYNWQLSVYETTQPGVEFRRISDPERPNGETRSHDALPVAREVITEAIVALGLEARIRADAQLLLLLNIHQMVALPACIAANANFPDTKRQQLVEAVQLILEAAALATNTDDKITAASIARGVALVLDKLHPPDV